MSKFYITTAIPYVNAPPHIGFSLELAQADVLARRERLRDKEVFFLTGTDEHGLKNYRTALAAGKTPADFADEHSDLFKALLGALNISSDDFIRTIDRKRHWPAAQKLWRALANSGDIYKKPYQGFYCAGHETFHPELELVGGECPSYPGRKLEFVEEENYFFRLSKYTSELKLLIAKEEIRILPESRKNEILALLETGLEDVSFSRQRSNLSWGIPVPEDPEHTMYVWCDALSNYLSGVDYIQAGAKFQKFWPPDIQVIGKDILRFHAAIWPAMLLSAKLPLPKTILVHGFITSGGQKMSKTAGNVVDPFEMIDKYGADAVRYFLLREIPTTEDGDFTEAKLKERYNADLANGLGNLLARVLAIGEKYGREFTIGAEDLSRETKESWDAYEKAFWGFRLHEALASIWRVIHRTDEYLNQKEPWRMLKGHDYDFSESLGDEISQVLSSSILALANIAWMLQPFLPVSAKIILESLGLSAERAEPWRGRKIILAKGPLLFPKKD
jgi:methionyl-tRNA synthetase